MLYDFEDGNYCSSLAAQVIAYIAKNIEPSPSLDADDNCFLAMQGLRNKTWELLISTQPDNQLAIVHIV